MVVRVGLEGVRQRIYISTWYWFTYAVLSDVRNHATGRPRPVSGCRRRTVKVESFFVPNLGMIFVVL